jgi:hypothetical protein
MYISNMSREYDYFKGKMKLHSKLHLDENHLFFLAYLLSGPPLKADPNFIFPFAAAPPTPADLVD